MRFILNLKIITDVGRTKRALSLIRLFTPPPTVPFTRNIVERKLWLENSSIQLSLEKDYIGYCFTSLCDWSPEVSLPPPPIRSKIKTNHDLALPCLSTLRAVYLFLPKNFHYLSFSVIGRHDYDFNNSNTFFQFPSVSLQVFLSVCYLTVYNFISSRCIVCGA